MFTVKRVPAKHKFHPLERPQELLVAWIEAVSFPGEKGGDPFGGGGSLMEACMTLGRDCVIIEKDETNYGVIVDRYTEIQKEMKQKKGEVEKV